MKETDEDNNIEQYKLLYRDSQSPDAKKEQLVKIVGKFYTRVLDLTDILLKYNEAQVNLLHEQDLLTCQNMKLEYNLSAAQNSLHSKQKECAELTFRIMELEATTAKLTEWNGSLDEQCSTLSNLLDQNQKSFNQIQFDLQRDLLNSTTKQIILRQEMDHLEEETFALRKTLQETTEILQKVKQENCILKSKLYDGNFSESPLTISSGDIYPRLESVSLDDENNSGIKDALRQLRLAAFTNNKYQSRI